MNKKLLMFDLDGTLFDTAMANHAAYQYALKKVLPDVSQKDFNYEYFKNKCNGRNYRTFIPELAPNVTDAELTKIHKIKQEAYSKQISQIVKNQQLFWLIELTKQDSFTALVTTASKKNVDQLLDFFDAKKWFDLIITGDDVEQKKPNPEGYQKAMKYFGVSPCDCLVFEDSEEGVSAAKGAGCQVLTVKINV